MGWVETIRTISVALSYKSELDLQSYLDDILRESLKPRRTKASCEL